MVSGITAEEWQRLLDRWGGPLELFAAQWTDSPEDCVQESFMQLARQTKWPDNVGAWLFRVVRHRAMGLARSAIRRRKHETRAAQWTAAAAIGQVIGDSTDSLEVLQTLNDELREIVVARVWGELGFEQLAEVFDISAATAFRRYESALRVLRDRMGVTCRD